MSPQPKIAAPVALKVPGLTAKAATGIVKNAVQINRPRNLAMAGVAAQKAAPVAAPRIKVAAPQAPAQPQAPTAMSVARQRAVLQPQVQARPLPVQAPAAQQSQVVQPQAAMQTMNQYHVTPHGKPLFTHEGNYKAAYAFFAPYAKPGPYTTPLNRVQQGAFNAWVAKYHVPVTIDYDMQGYWLAHPNATYNGSSHFPDTYKTPYDTTFSRESKYSTANNPFDWVGQKLINIHTGKIIFEGSD